MKNISDKRKLNIILSGFELMLVGLLTGALVGVIVTFFNIAADVITEYSGELYVYIQQNPAFIPLLFLVLIAGAFLIGTATYFVPMIKGNGVPQAEGASRGVLELKWYKVLPAMAASSLLIMFLGVTACAEGPSMLIGAMTSDGASRLLRSSDMERRYYISGGACAGVAVAANAPITGILFALEEAHRRFTPPLLITAFSSVVSAVITRNLIRGSLNMSTGAAFNDFTIVQLPINAYLYVVLSVIVCALLGIAIYNLAHLSQKLLSKVTALRGAVRIAIPLIFAGVIGLITVYATGSGHSLIEALGTKGGAEEMSLKGIFSTPLLATLAIIIALRLLSLCLNIGAQLPAGIFVPTIALGACVGAFMAQLCIMMGMDKAYADAIVLICMATIFAATVKAPLTAIVMVIEFTWQFTLFVPVIIGVLTGYFLSELFRNKPIYDMLLEEMMDEENAFVHDFSAIVRSTSPAEGREIRDIIWPGDVTIYRIDRGQESIVPSSETELESGDVIHIKVLTVDSESIENDIKQIVAPRRKKFRRNSNRLSSFDVPVNVTDNIQANDAELNENMIADPYVASDVDTQNNISDPNDNG